MNAARITLQLLREIIRSHMHNENDFIAVRLYGELSKPKSISNTFIIYFWLSAFVCRFLIRY